MRLLRSVGKGRSLCLAGLAVLALGFLCQSAVLAVCEDYGYCDPNKCVTITGGQSGCRNDGRYFCCYYNQWFDCNGDGAKDCVVAVTYSYDRGHCSPYACP